MLKTLNSTNTCSLIRASDYSIKTAQCTCPPQELDGQRRRLAASRLVSRDPGVVRVALDERVRAPLDKDPGNC